MDHGRVHRARDATTCGLDNLGDSLEQVVLAAARELRHDGTESTRRRSRRRGPYEDVDVLVQRGQEAQQALGGRSGQPPVQHVGDLGLVDPEDVRRHGPRIASGSQQPVNTQGSRSAIRRVPRDAERVVCPLSVAMSAPRVLGV